MKAKIVNKDARFARNYAPEKEMVSAYSVIGKVGGEIREVVTARSYMDRSRGASMVYCSLWVSGSGLHQTGSGSAGGYGYHKESAALAEAIRSAGFELSEDIAGRGCDAMQDALEAVARAVGARGALLFVSH